MTTATTTFVIKPANWTMHLADAIEQAKDGDTIQVDSQDKAELAKRALGRVRPGADIHIEVVRPSDIALPAPAPVKRGGIGWK